MTRFSIAAALCVATAPALAQSNARHTLEAIFYSFDSNHDGVVSVDEMNGYINSSFKEMDPKHTGVVTKEAFRNYSIGLADVAAENGRSDAYEAAKDASFKRWSGGKDTMTLDQYRAGVLGDVRIGEGGDPRGLTLQAFERTPLIKGLLRSLR